MYDSATIEQIMGIYAHFKNSIRFYHLIKESLTKEIFVS
jgi:hypothetical protein